MFPCNLRNLWMDLPGSPNIILKISSSIAPSKTI